MEFEPSRARTLMREALSDVDDATPLFYALTGSHLYGFDDDTSDVDIRGFHLVPAERYAYLHQPQEEIVVNMDGTTEGFEAFEEIDFKSYSLRKFGSLLRKANYTVIELVCSGDLVYADDSFARDRLQDVIQTHLPMNVPHSYVGLAKKYYNRDIKGDSPATPKQHLYAHRGLLAAEYVVSNNSIEPNIRTLAKAVHSGDAELIDSLIAVKRSGDELSQSLHERSASRIGERLETLDLPNAGDKTPYSRDLDEWMRSVRV